MRCGSQKDGRGRGAGRFSRMGSRMDDFVDYRAKPHRGAWNRVRNWGTNRMNGLYRSRDGLIFGVCRGVAEYFDLSTGWIRFFTILAFIMTGLWPVGFLYIIMALIMKKAPAIPPRNEAEEEFYASYADSRRNALSRLNRTYDSMERRLQRIEDTVTSREFQWQTRADGKSV